MLSQWRSRFQTSTVLRNAGWMFAGQGISVVNQALYFLALARLLGVTQYGLLVGAGATVAMVSQYSSLGWGFLFLRYVGPDRSKFPEYWGGILTAILSVGTLLIVALYVTAHWLLRTIPVSLLMCLAIGDCICSQVTLACGQIFQTYEKMRITATLNMLTNLARMLLSASLLLTLKHATAAQWAYTSLAISTVAAIAAVSVVAVQLGLPTIDQKLFRMRLSEGFLFAVTGSTTNAYNDLDKAMLGHYGMNAANGIYTMAYRVVDIACLPIRSIHSAVLPRFFRHGADGVAATENYARSIVRKTFPVALAAGICMFLAAPLVPHMLGAGFRESVHAIRWLALLPLFRCLHLSAGDAMAGAGYQKYRFSAQAAAAGSNFALNLYLIPRYSWRGAAFASLLTDGALGAVAWTILIALRRRDTGRTKLLDLAPKEMTPC